MSFTWSKLNSQAASKGRERRRVQAVTFIFLRLRVRGHLSPIDKKQQEFWESLFAVRLIRGAAASESERT